MDLNYTGVNWVAVVAAAVANIIIGIVWYAPQVFGRRWAALGGRELPAPGQIPVTTYALGVVVALVVAYVLALFVGGLGASSIVDGATVGFLAWLGFAATTASSAVLYEGRSWVYWALNAGFTLVALLVMGAILAYWP
jgi:hypothetical protein